MYLKKEMMQVKMGRASWVKSWEPGEESNEEI